MNWQSVTASLEVIRFLHPGWLWAWPATVIGVLVLLRSGRLGPLGRFPDILAARRYRHTRTDILRSLGRNDSPRTGNPGLYRRGLSYALLLLFIHLSLAQPYRLGQELPTPPQYRDTLFVMDTAISMRLRDYLVNGERTERMTMVKSVLTHFIDQLEGNRIGLIAFSEQAYTLAPLSTDTHLLKTMVRHLEPAVLTGRTSDVGRALTYTLQQLQQWEHSGQSHKPVVVLVSDVNRTERDIDPRAVAAVLHGRGYRVHTVGMGATRHEARDDTSSGLIYQPVNFRLLKAIAENGGGKFYPADNARSLGAAVRAIQSGERREVKVEPRHVTIPLYHWPLLAGLMWLILLQLASRPGRPR